MGKTIIIELAKELKGKVPYMGLASIDSYGNILIREINFETRLDPADTFSLCNKCGLPVVDSSIVPGTDDKNGFGTCDHCHDSHKEPNTDQARLVITDCWGDQKVVPLFADTSLVAADYLMPCAHCGVAVLVDNIPENMDTCNRCNIGHHITTQDIVSLMDSCAGQPGPCTKCDIFDLCTLGKCVRLPSPPKEVNIMSMEERIKVARQEAEDAFWAVIVKHFPEATDGSFLMSDMDDIMLSWVQHWVDLNVKEAEHEKFEEWTEDLHLHYQSTWHLHHTGGGCMVATTDNVVVAAEHRYLAISSECVCIYTDNFTGEDFLMEPHTIWSFGENPTVLMNHIDEFFGGSVLWDTGKLFDDIMTIGKSSHVQ